MAYDPTIPRKVFALWVCVALDTGLQTSLEEL